MNGHCDDLIDDPTQPEALRRYLGWARLPASCKYPPKDPAHIKKWIAPELWQYVWKGPEPRLFADHDGRRVRVVMASRFGDVGITSDLKADHGYNARVSVSALSNFSDRP